MVVTYSSISTNEFEPYGECVMGTAGTMIVEAEQNVYLFTGARPEQEERRGPPKATAAERVDASGDKPALEAGADLGRPGRGREQGRRGGGRQPRLPRGDGRLRLLRQLWNRRRTRRTAGCRAATARWRWPTPSSR